MRPVSLEQLGVIKPDRAWVTVADQPMAVISGPQMVGDTLVGYINGQYEELPRANVKQIIVQRNAPTRTALLATAIALGVGGFAYVLTGSAGGGKPPNAGAGDCDKHPEDPGCQI
jgi:hypothetical protein